NTLFTQSVNKTEVIELINNLKIDTATGHDNIPVKLFKHIAKCNVDHCIYINNLSLQNGIIPSQFKISQIINNYQKISLALGQHKIQQMLYIRYLSKFICDALDNNKKVIEIFLKAFYTIDHKELPKIMLSFRVMKESYKCFISYLNDRIQKVNINDNILDNDKTLNCGIP
ncbi:hypothetical protein AGLY_015280, partial [Aphis glycines]